MGIFDVFKHKNELSFIQSPNYKGFKKFGLVSYGHKPSEDGLKKLHKKTPDFDLTGSQIKLVDFVYDGDRHGVAVYVDDLQVGSYFGNNTNSLTDLVKARKITAVFVRVDKIKKIDGETFGALLFVKSEE